MKAQAARKKYNKSKNNLFNTAVEKARDRTCHKQGTL